MSAALRDAVPKYFAALAGCGGAMGLAALTQLGPTTGDEGLYQTLCGDGFAPLASRTADAAAGVAVEVRARNGDDADTPAAAWLVVSLPNGAVYTTGAAPLAADAVPRMVRQLRGAGGVTVTPEGVRGLVVRAGGARGAAAEDAVVDACGMLLPAPHPVTLRGLAGDALAAGAFGCAIGAFGFAAARRAAARVLARSPSATPGRQYAATCARASAACVLPALLLAPVAWRWRDWATAVTAESPQITRAIIDYQAHNLAMVLLQTALPMALILAPFAGGAGGAVGCVLYAACGGAGGPAAAGA